MIKSWPIQEYQEPPDNTLPPDLPPIHVPAAVVSPTLDTLNLLDEFFRQASPTTRAELRAFAALHSWDPVQSAELIIQGIGFDTLNLTRTRDATHSNQP